MFCLSPRCAAHLLRRHLIVNCLSSFLPCESRSKQLRQVSDERKWRLLKFFETKVKRQLRPKLQARPEKPHIGLFGAPLVHGQLLSGAAAAPDLLRDSFLIDRLLKKGATVTDHGDLIFVNVLHDGEHVMGCKNAKTVGLANQQIADKVKEVLNEGAKCLVLGGDHSIGIGAVAGHLSLQEDAALIWVDAHPDINTPLTSASGNLHGMPVAFLVKELPHCSPPVPGLEWVKPCISAQQLAYIGLRSIDPKEKEFIKDLNICAFTVSDVHRFGIEFVMDMALRRIDPQANRPLHLSFDVDAIDPELMPATGTPVANGLTLAESLGIAHYIFQTGRLSVMDVVELNPLLTTKTLAYWSADVAVEVIVRAFCGKRRRIPVEEQKDLNSEQVGRTAQEAKAAKHAESRQAGNIRVSSITPMVKVATGKMTTGKTPREKTLTTGEMSTRKIFTETKMPKRRKSTWKIPMTGKTSLRKRQPERRPTGKTDHNSSFKRK